MSSMRRGMRNSVVGVASIVFAMAVIPTGVQAQCAAGAAACSRVSPDAKGMIGLGLLGAELGFVIPALVQEAAHTNEWWPYLVFPVIGAAGGVVGGYFMEQETRNSPEIDVAFMAIGLGLAVPALVTTLALTAYDPNDSGGDSGEAEPEPEDDQAPPTSGDDETTTEAVQVESSSESDGPADSGGADSTDSSGSGASGSSPTSRRPAAPSHGASRPGLLVGGPGLLRFDGPRVLLGVPMVRRIATFTAREQESLQLMPSSDINVPVVSGTF